MQSSWAMRARVLRELVQFVFASKRYWLLPVILILLLLGFALVVTDAAFIGPFLYTLF